MPSSRSITKTTEKVCKAHCTQELNKYQFSPFPIAHTPNVSPHTQGQRRHCLVKGLEWAKVTHNDMRP